ncbi:serine carboxypeptidase-like 33 [Dioscorea cayenensis subsp. rotundata]|uniref:Serine carboxypeptidase-like 33 n=1 Tax=Dioscorea cayennensis subsp. rotundata TaxID=55577 RepID=A0AB40B4A5_DIOCR|nr:serine carboxypeptidase-like 33 [Dioscorea cayenensis subsp. rotundata]
MHINSSHKIITIDKQLKHFDAPKCLCNVYAPKCNNAHASSSLYSKRLLQRTRTPAGYDPCYSVYAEEYFNRVDVQRAMHASFINNGKWKVCNESILDIYNNTVSSVLPIYSKLINAGLRIWIYR